MLIKINFLALVIVTYGAISGIKAQPCVPNPVGDVDLSPEGILSWSASENCPDTQYIIRISRQGAVQYEYTVDELSLDVSFLVFCRNFIFTVTPVSDNLIGMETNSEAMIALPDDVDIQILNFTASPIDNNLLFNWSIDEKYRSCIRYYLLHLWHEETIKPNDWFFFGGSGYYLEEVASCMKYRFDLTAFYYETNGTTASFNYTIPEKTNTPSLQFVKQDALTINTTWVLESFSVNRCKVTALHVNGTYFNTTIPIEDTPERPHIDVSVTGLRADSMYYFNATVENEGGISRPFQMAVQTLPIDPSLENNVA